MRRIDYRGLVSALLLCLLAACSDDHGRIAGSGSVTTNGLSGRILRDGLPASGVTVSLYPSDYDPVRDSALPDSRKRITDRGGKFLFQGIEAGDYSLVARHPSQGALSILQGIRIGRDPDSEYALPDLALKPAGVIRIPLPEFAREASGYFYLPGTGISAILDSAAVRSGELRLEGVPAAAYLSLLYVKPGADSARNVLDGGMAVTPEGIATVKPYATWKAAWKIALDGSAIGGNLAGYPLLVRLDAANFDFSAAAPDGADLRVTGSDSLTDLPFEIESWDPAGKTAALWVRVDTLRGGDASGFLCLFAGNAGASAPAPAVVFDTASGFRGVWHLGEDPAQGPRAILDRTANAYHGSANGAMALPGSSASGPGIIGRGLRFDGKKDYVALNASNTLIRSEGQPLTVSAWIRPSALKTAGDSICNRLISFKTDSGAFSSFAWGIDDSGRMAHYTRANDSVYHWSAAIKADSTYFVALTFAGGRFTGYVDGRADFAASGLTLPAGGAMAALVGAHESGNRQYQGLLDELRIGSVARSPDWIRMDYESQKPGSTVTRVIRLK